MLARRRQALEMLTISALDLFASSLGVFVLMAILLFPYYLREPSVEAELLGAQAELSERSGLVDPLANDPRPTYQPFPLVSSTWLTRLDYVLYRAPKGVDLKASVDILRLRIRLKLYFFSISKSALPKKPPVWLSRKA